MTESITLAESKRLVALEKIVEAGKQQWVDVGNALTEIRDNRLYRADYATFEDYCREKWGWSRSYAYRLIDSAEVKMSPIGDKIKNEGQAREVAKVEPEKREEVVGKADATAKAENRPMTAKDVSNAAERTPGAKKKSSPPPPPKPKKADRKPIGPVDETGLEIPEVLLETWALREDVTGLMTYVSAMRVNLKKHQDAGHKLLSGPDAQGIQMDLDAAFGKLKAIKPYAVCPTCLGKQPENCGMCHGIGLVSQFFWAQCVPSETKTMREHAVKAQNEKYAA